MQYHIQSLVKHLFDKDSFEQVTVQELKQFTEAYPYAAVGQFLYAKKLYDARSWNYYEQTEQANLYFHNPLWFRWLMDQKYDASAMTHQEEIARQSPWRAAVQMPKESSPLTGNKEDVARENEAAVSAEDAETQLHEFQPGIDSGTPIQAATEEIGFIQAPASSYTEAVTDNTGDQPQPLPQEAGQNETPVQTGEQELNLHEFKPGSDTAPILADAEAFGDIQEKEAAQEYTEAVTDNTKEEESTAEAINEPGAIETIAGIPAAKEETEITPEFFTEAAAAARQETPAVFEGAASTVAIAESMMQAEGHAAATGNDLEKTLAAAYARVTQETTEIDTAPEPAVSEITNGAEAATPAETAAGTFEPEAPETAASAPAGEPATSVTHEASAETTEFVTETASQEISAPGAAAEQEQHVTHEASAATGTVDKPETAIHEVTAPTDSPVETGEPAEQTATAESLADIHIQASGFPAELQAAAEEPLLEEDDDDAGVIAGGSPETEIHEPAPKEPAFNIPVTQEPTGEQWKVEPVFTPASKEPKTSVEIEEPIFESYHTIDYFASQGIKLQQEDFKDRLGKQLKSFTEWLRAMKRIVPTEASASLDDITTRSIQRIAEHSVEEKEVITEAMAEVWAKQGHTQKAISVYEKLSLLNPAKSPYFAGRIEQLKAL